MERREPVVAGMFYEAAEQDCRRHVERCIAGHSPPDDLGDLLGGVVPHAGWSFSGPTAAKVFLALRKSAPETFVLLGAVHRSFRQEPAAFPEGAWVTPLGEVAVDAEALAAVREAGIDVSAEEHADEHSIEVQIPFIQVLFPDARIVPITVPHAPGAAEAGRRIGSGLAKFPRRLAVVASTDLTHYGMGYHGTHHGPLPKAMGWMRQNDARMIALIEKLEADSVVDEAAAHENACGAGAVAAGLAAARELGARRGRVLDYTTSADVMHERWADRAVGYLAAVFEK